REPRLSRAMTWHTYGVQRLKFKVQSAFDGNICDRKQRLNGESLRLNSLRGNLQLHHHSAYCVSPWLDSDRLPGGKGEGHRYSQCRQREHRRDECFSDSRKKRWHLCSVDGRPQRICCG